MLFAQAKERVRERDERERETPSPLIDRREVISAQSPIFFKVNLKIVSLLIILPLKTYW